MKDSGDYISRKAAFAECDWYANEFSECEYAIMPLKGALEILPAADVRPVVRGFNKLKDYPGLFECSVCGWECGDTVPGDTETYNFCPNCGAYVRPEPPEEKPTCEDCQRECQMMGLDMEACASYEPPKEE